MPYRFKRGKDVASEVRRIAAEQIGRAIGEIDSTELDRHEAVHQVRKRCKKVRALARLVRPCFDRSREENAAFRDAARTLSRVRDTQTLIDTCDALAERFADEIDRAALERIRGGLTERRKRIAGDGGELAERLAAFRAEMERAKSRVADWSIDEEGFDALRGGLEKTYGRGRRAMAKAYADPSPERFHEWRKRVKDHWHHSRLLRTTWKRPLRAWRDELDELAHLLGQDHDLAVFRETLSGNAEDLGGKRSVQAALALAERWRAELEARAWPLGRAIFVEKRRQLGRRFARYWTVWTEADEGEPGLADRELVAQLADEG